MSAVPPAYAVINTNQETTSGPREDTGLSRRILRVPGSRRERVIVAGRLRGNLTNVSWKYV